MILTGKTIHNIKIKSHSVPGQQIKKSADIKKELNEYMALREANNKLTQFRKKNANFKAIDENLGALIRQMRMNLFKKNTRNDQFVEYQYAIPLNVAINIHGLHSRKLSDYSLVYNDSSAFKNDDSVFKVIKTMKDRRDRLIKEARNNLKRPRPSPRFWSFMMASGKKYDYTLSAGCHTIPGQFLDFLKLKKMKHSVFTEKRPTTNENHVGIELEFVCKLNGQNLGVKLALAELGEFVTLKTDGSVRDESGSGYYPHELTVCVPESKMEGVVNTICEVLNGAGAKVNKSCGFHVHLDMRNRDKAVSFNNLVHSQYIMYAMQPRERRENTFCKKTKTAIFEQAVREAGASGSGRYQGVNAQAFARHSTIEIRMHSGTTNAMKITNWVKILCAIANKSQSIQSEIRNVRVFATEIGIPSDVVSYIESRIVKFKNHTVGVENENNGIAA
jgi:hypothetical protein